jgi:GTP-binding protein Era
MSDLGTRSGLATLVGRPNVGKSTLVNRLVGTKVTITAHSPNTTRRAIRGVLDRPGYQLVLVDTPGIHTPRSALGARLNASATGSIADVDCCVLVLDGRVPIGPGDRFVARQLTRGSVVALNKTDRMDKEMVLRQLQRAATELELRDAEYFPISARTGDGVDELLEHVVAKLPEGPRYFPPEMHHDLDEAFFLGELVREQLLRVAREELPHSIACRVTEWEWPRITCAIFVERESQKGIVIGHGGSVLKQVGIAVRRQLPPGAYLELVVKVERDWQRRSEVIERLGY